MSAYDQLHDQMIQASLLGSSAGLLGWDQETMMPEAGLAHRSRQLAQLARLSHEMGTDPKVADLLAECEVNPSIAGNPTSAEAVNVREWRRDYDKQVKLPGDLIEALTATSSQAKADWQEARKAADYAKFKPTLEKLVGLLKEKAAALSEGNPVVQEPWDALADEYEPNMTAADVSKVFTPLRERLVTLLGRLRDDGTPPPHRFIQLKLPIDQQQAFVREVAAKIGFDFARGRLDLSTHPFCGGSHCHDVRMTTRFSEDNLPDALSSTMHESGHGMYEQGLPAQHIGTPRGHSVSLSIHESQSRMWENQVGRSRAFWEWGYPKLKAHFGTAIDSMDGFGVDELYRTCNRVEPGFIRVEADEATYNLHIMIRFEIERMIMSGALDLADLPEAWNTKYKDYLGLTVPNDGVGCLQDIHWSMGAIGYFPTYTMGNLYSAQFYETAKAALPDLDASFAAGDFAPLLGWLRTNIHEPGMTYLGPDLVKKVTGRELSADPLLSYLEEKLFAVYGIDA